MHRFDSFSPWAPTVLRVGIAIVIGWFGISQLLDPGAWTSWVPAWAGISGLSQITVVYLNGALETIAAAMLILNIIPRIVAGVLFVHMCVIVLDIGWNPTGVRDFGIAVALLTIFLAKIDSEEERLPIQ